MGPRTSAGECVTQPTRDSGGPERILAGARTGLLSAHVSTATSSLLVTQGPACPACHLALAVVQLPFCHSDGALPLGSRLCRCCRALHVKFSSSCIRAEASVLGPSKPFLVPTPPSSAARFCPCSGSDAASIQTRAVLSEDGAFYILNGSKVRLLACWVSAPLSPPAQTAVHAPGLSERAASWVGAAWEAQCLVSVLCLLGGRARMKVCCHLELQLGVCLHLLRALLPPVPVVRNCCGSVLELNCLSAIGCPAHGRACTQSCRHTGMYVHARMHPTCLCLLGKPAQGRWVEPISVHAARLP